MLFRSPEALLAAFQFEPGQFITVRAQLQGQEVRRNYSLCSTPALLSEQGLIQIGVRAVAGGLMSNHLQAGAAGQTLSVAPPEGRFVIRRPRALHRVGFAAGSGITPILSILTHTLESHPVAKFTLVYGNRRMDSVMFNEALQDLKDRFPYRLTLIHVLSRQAQEVPLLEGHIDADKVRELMRVFLPVNSMDEVFICGPEAMIDATESALVQAGVPKDRVYTERFTAGERVQGDAPVKKAATSSGKRIALTVVAVQLLALPMLQIIGGLLLVWIAVQLLDQDAEGEEEATTHHNLYAAIRTILLADVVMSLDNVIGVAAAAKGNLVLLGFGLALSIPLVVFGSSLMIHLMNRYPIIITLGAALIGWVAGETLISDVMLADVVAHWHGWHWLAPGLFALGVLLWGRWRQTRPSVATPTGEDAV